jgi:hypothetical protein
MLPSERATRRLEQAASGTGKDAYETYGVTQELSSDESLAVSVRS